MRFLWVVCLIPCTGCWISGAVTGRTLVGSGNVVSETRDHSDFDRVHVSNAFELAVSQNESFRVTIQADDNVLPHVVVAQEGARLRLGLENGFYNLRNVTLKATVSMPDLRELDASGASMVTLEDFVATEPLKLEASGASKIVGDVDCTELAVELSGASRAELTGSVGSLGVEASGASTAKLTELMANEATANASGASSAHVTAIERVSASASGASKVVYGGDAELASKHESGASSVRKR